MEILLMPILFIIDQWTKKKAETGELGNGWILNDYVKLGLVFNNGAMLGLFGKNKKMLWLFSGISVVILLVISIPVFLMKGHHLLKLSVSLLGGGALGNLYDRFKKGRVTDFFAFKWRKKLYFNLADLFVFLGGLLYVIGSLFNKK